MAETFSHLEIEDIACLFESRKSIRIQYCRPSVTIIASLVAGGEDVVVERRTVAGDNLRNHLHFSHSLCLKYIDIKICRVGNLMIIHIENRRTQEFGFHKTLVESRCAVDFLNQRVRHNLTCLIMLCIGFYYLGSVAIVLHKLRGQFDKVARGVGTGKALVGSLCQQAVKCVSELVEERLHIVHREERRIAFRRFVEVAYIDNHRTMVHALGVDILALYIVHPSPRTFACAGEIVGIENTYQIILGIRYFEHLYFRVINGHISQRLKIKPIQVVCQLKHAFAHIAQLEIGFELLLIKVIFCLAEFLGIVPPIPRLECLAGHIFVHNRL